MSVPSFLFTGTSWDWAQASAFPIPEMMVSLCEPAQTKELLYGKLEADFKS